MAGTTHVRRRDINEATEILALVDERGGTPLPQLTDADLCVFSDAFATMLDREVWMAWLDLPDAERVRRADLVRGFLVRRRLLRVAPVASGPVGSGPVGSGPVASGPVGSGSVDGTGMHQGLRIQPKLGFILAARRYPSFVGLCSVPGVAQRSAPHLFGLGDQTRATPTLLLEQVSERRLPVLGHIREYALLLPERAAKVVASWMAGTLRDPAHPACVLDLFTHTPQQRLHVERVTVRAGAAGDALRFEHTRRDGSYVQRGGLTETALADLVAPILTPPADPAGAVLRHQSTAPSHRE